MKAITTAVLCVAGYYLMLYAALWLVGRVASML